MIIRGIKLIADTINTWIRVRKSIVRPGLLHMERGGYLRFAQLINAFMFSDARVGYDDAAMKRKAALDSFASPTSPIVV